MKNLMQLHSTAWTFSGVLLKVSGIHYKDGLAAVY